MGLLEEDRYPWACWGKGEEWGKSYKSVYVYEDIKIHIFVTFNANTKIYCGYYLGIFVELHTVGAGTYLTFLPALETVFLLLHCLVQEE